MLRSSMRHFIPAIIPKAAMLSHGVRYNTSPQNGSCGVTAGCCAGTIVESSD